MLLKTTYFQIFFEGFMLKSIFTLLLLGVFVLSVQAKGPIQKNNIEKAARYQIIQNTRTVEFNKVNRTRTRTNELRTNTIVLNSSAQVDNLGSSYGYSKSNSQVDNLGSSYGYSKSNSQVGNLGSSYGYSKSNSQVDNLGSSYGYSK